MKKSTQLFFSRVPKYKSTHSRIPAGRNQGQQSGGNNGSWYEDKAYLLSLFGAIGGGIGALTGGVALYQTHVAGAREELNDIEKKHQDATLDNFDALVAGDPDTPRVRLKLHHNQKLNDLEVIEKNLRRRRIYNKMLQKRMQSTNSLFISRKNRILEELQEQLFRLDLALYINQLTQAYITLDFERCERVVDKVKKYFVKRDICENNSKPVEAENMNKVHECVIEDDLEQYRYFRGTYEPNLNSSEDVHIQRLIDTDPRINMMLANYYNIKGNYLRTYKSDVHHDLSKYEEHIHEAIDSYNKSLSHARSESIKKDSQKNLESPILSNIGFAYNKLAQVQAALGKTSESREMLIKAHDHHKMARDSYLKDGNYRGIFSGYGFGLQRLAMITKGENQNKMLEEAADQYRLAEDPLEVNADVIFNKAELLTYTDKAREAIDLLEDLSKSNNENKDHPDLYYLLANAYLKEGKNFELASQNIKKCQFYRRQDLKRSVWYLDIEVESLAEHIRECLSSPSNVCKRY